MRRILPWELLRGGWRTIRHAWVPLMLTMFAFQLLLLIVVSPLIGWLFREALRANGMFALDFNALRFTGGIGISLTLIILILLLAFWIAALQFIVLIVMLRRSRNREDLSARSVWAEALSVSKKLFLPSSFPLFCYLFIIVPLSGFGFATTLARGITVPTFISGELMKSPTTGAIWIGFMLLLAILNLRFALALPVFVLTKATGAGALRQSWRLTSGFAALRLTLAVLGVIAFATLASLALFLLAIAPTALSDELWPTASPIVAALSLGIAQVFGLLLTALIVTLLGAILLALTAQEADRLTGGLVLDWDRTDPRPKDTPAAAPAHRSQRKRFPAVVAGLSVVALSFGLFHLGTMQQLSQHPNTLVLGHRGFSDGGVENTIAGLEAAAKAGADMVEIDVLQTADKRFVVLHDASLTRLTGEGLLVKDLTLDQLTAITVRDQFGHEGKIPSLAAYVERAKSLEMPLLIEVKLGGLDTPDHVDLLVKELDALDAIDGNIFHTLDLPSVERLKQLRPDATVGYILAVAGVDIPATDADFVVVEQWSATQEMQDAAARAGYGFFSWTVNELAHIRELLRRDIDGIITDHPDVALSSREEMRQETGLAGTLIDALTRFVLVF